MATLVLELTQPIQLWALALIPIIAGIYWYLTNRISRSQSPNSWLRFVVPKDAAWKRHGAVLLVLLGLASPVVAWAMPKDYGKQAQDWAAIVVTIDISWSTETGDVSPNRLEATKESAKKLIASLPERFNIALATFVGTTSVSAPPTMDQGVLDCVMDSTQVVPSTAIGEAIYTSLGALKLAPSDPDHPNTTTPAAIVLLSDGTSNLGWDSAAVARRSEQLGVPVYTIAYSIQNGYAESNGRRERAAVDHHELYVVAENSGGKKFSAESASELSEIYQAIFFDPGCELVPTEITDQYAGLVIISAILAVMGAISLGVRWP